MSEKRIRQSDGAPAETLAEDREYIETGEPWHPVRGRRGPIASGVSKRERFALTLATEILCNEFMSDRAEYHSEVETIPEHISLPERVARKAVACADALLAELDKPRESE